MPEVDIKSIIGRLNKLTPESLQTLSYHNRLKLRIRLERLDKIVSEELEKRK